MRKNKTNYNLLTEDELWVLNRELVPLFGTSNRITSGSYCMCKGNKLQYHIVVGDTSTHQSFITLKGIGERVKKILGAYEVYSFGIKLA